MQTPLDNDPTPVNIILLVIAVVIGVTLVGYVGWQNRKIQRKRLEDEAEGAATSRMPGGENGGYGAAGSS